MSRDDRSMWLFLWLGWQHVIISLVGPRGAMRNVWAHIGLACDIVRKEPVSIKFPQSLLSSCRKSNKKPLHDTAQRASSLGTAPALRSLSHFVSISFHFVQLFVQVPYFPSAWEPLSQCGSGELWSFGTRVPWVKPTRAKKGSAALKDLTSVCLGLCLMLSINCKTAKDTERKLPLSPPMSKL